jgi:hypothetical protein
MSNIKKWTLGLLAALLLGPGCAPVPTPQDAGPPPPQNLLGSTDELQLVAELSLDLASRYGVDRVLVVLEIDNLLLTVEDDPGSEQWNNWQSALEMEDPCSSPQIAQKLALPMRPLQDSSVTQVQRLQDVGLRVIVLTSRGPGCRQQSFEQLHSNGFRLEVNPWPPRNGYPDAFLPDGGSRPVIYENGVFFTSGQHKGMMLKALLELSGEPLPVLVVMADHSQQDLNEVMKTFSWTSTKVHAWRYTRE